MTALKRCWPMRLRGNTESGIDVTYDALTGKLNFAVHSGSGGATFRMAAGAPADLAGCG